MRTIIACIVVVMTLVASASLSLEPRTRGVAQDNRYVLRLSDGDGWFADMTVVEVGKPGAMTHRALPTLLFTPHRAEESLEVQVSAIEGDSPADGPGQLVQVLTLIPGRPVRVEGAGYVFNVEWVVTTTATEAPRGNRDDPEPCEQCCVTCGDRRICACRVEVQCGECCCPGCCIAGDRTNSGTSIAPAAPCTAGRRAGERGAASGEHR